MVAVLLTMYFTVKTQRETGDTSASTLITLWRSFPKFVLGFLIASVVATIFASNADPTFAASAIGVANELRTWFLILAFVSIGLEFSFGSLKEAGWKPVLVFAAATVVNLAVGLLLAVLLWGSFTF
ncbi:hypothetical protein SDC9_100902 [bioreactor metagenome]|uniref:Sulfate exporter family transporter n=1 Tax=bioreactor metagenome TaxID=1076179 RepID=A0A645ALV5_9ZZZZ